MSYSVCAIDLEKFSACPSSDVIVRLMWALNEMNQLADLGLMIEKEEQENPYLWKYYQGIRASLTRQRASKVAEALHTIVRPLVADDASTRFSALSEIIERDNILRRARLKLRRIFYGFLRDDFEKHYQVRHRITEHYDHKSNFGVTANALQTTIADLKSGGAKADGWMLAGTSPQNFQQSRYLLVDDVLSAAWRESILNIPFNPNGYKSSGKVRRTKRFMSYSMALLHRFASNMIDEYCKAYSLFIDCNPDDLMTVIEPD